MLLRAFEALRGHVAGAADDRRRLGAGGRPAAGRARGRDGARARVSDAEKRAALERADVLAAPSLGGESFGMVLTEALRGRHAGRRLRHRRLPRRGARRRRRRCSCRAATRPRWPRRCATLALDPERTAGSATAAGARRADRYAWPKVAARGRLRLRGRARGAEARQAPPSARRCAIGVALRRPRPAPAGAAAAVARAGARDRAARRACCCGAALILVAALGAIGGSYLAMERIGVDRVAHTLVTSSPSWVRVGLGADVRLDGLPRRLLGRDPEGGAARGTAALHRRLAGHRRRRADVGDAARAAR